MSYTSNIWKAMPHKN